MKYAIDRFVNNKSGKEIEISASDIYEMYSGRIIPHKSERFFCPECQEQVFWRCRGGNQPDKFCHKKKTDFTPECDKRVDGNSELYTYERTGLPIYLTHENCDIYNINIAFPGLGNQTLQEAFRNNASVTINNKSTINITPTNFYADSMTLIPIDFTPHSETNYIISISGDCTEAIQKKWSNYADGFSSEGAIFAIHNSFGKKIRRGDSIAIGKDYYLVSQNIYSLPPEFSLKKIGKITLNNCNYNIYTFIINVSVDSNRFSIINNYMYSHFKIWLIEEAATIMPIWPPVSDQGELIAFSNNNKIYCDVKSGNEIPKVFTYKGIYATQVIVDIDSNDNKTVSLDLYNTVSTIASVDRKYTGREISIRKAVISDEKESSTISLLSKNGKILDISGTINENDIKDGINIVTSTRFILVLETSTHIFKTISVNDKTLFVKPFQNVIRLIFINSDSPTEFKIFKTVNIQPPQTVCDINESEWIYNIKRRSQSVCRSSYENKSTPVNLITLAQHNTMYSGVSKKHIYEKSTSILKSMLNRCPEITPWFYANKDTEDPIHIVRRRLIRNGDLQNIGFENTLTISPRSTHSICPQAEQINGIFFERNAFYSGVSSLRLTPYHKTENTEPNVTEWFDDYCINAWWEDGSIHNDTAEYFDCNTNSKNIHSCWKKSPSQFQKHIRLVRIVINRNMFEYYLEKEYHNTILHHKIDPFLVEIKEHRKMMLALRKDANTPIPACIKIFEDYSTLNLWVHLPYDMMEYLESYTWPSRNITDVLEWKYPLCLVSEIKNKLEKLGINVTEEKYG